MAYWAGGIHILERRKPLLIPIRSLNGISKAVSKAACIQVMHKRGTVDVPISATVDYNILKPLIKGASAALKPYLIER